MKTIAEIKEYREKDAIKVHMRLKSNCPRHNLVFAVRQDRFTYDEPERDKDGEIVRDAEGKPKMKTRYRFRPIDIPKSERWFASDEDQEGVLRGGKVHSVTQPEFEWLQREIDCHIIRFEHPAKKGSKNGCGPNQAYRRARMIRAKRQDHENPGEFIPNPDYQPAFGGKSGGRLLAVDVPLGQFVEMRRAVKEDEAPVHVNPENGARLDWDAIAQADPSANEETIESLKAQIAELKAEREKELDAEAGAVEAEQKSSTRRGRRRRS